MLIIILGAVDVQWINTQVWEHPIDNEEDEPTGSRRLDDTQGDNQ